MASFYHCCPLLLRRFSNHNWTTTRPNNTRRCFHHHYLSDEYMYMLLVGMCIYISMQTTQPKNEWTIKQSSKILPPLLLLLLLCSSSNFLLLLLDDGLDGSRVHIRQCCWLAANSNACCQSPQPRSSDGRTKKKCNREKWYARWLSGLTKNYLIVRPT